LEQFGDDAFHCLSPFSEPAPGFDHGSQREVSAYNPRRKQYNVCFLLIVSG
jgi:hypothetical protein